MKIKIYFKRSVSSKSDVKRVMKEVDLMGDSSTIKREQDFQLVSIEAEVYDETEIPRIEDHKCVAMVNILK